MNWKLILMLSLIGLLIAISSVSLVSMDIEMIMWLFTFITSGIIIAMNTDKPFYNGLILGLINCVWVTSAHELFFSSYIAHHPDMVQMSKNFPLADKPQLGMLLFSPVLGLVTGCIIGLIAFVAYKVMKK